MRMPFVMDHLPNNMHGVAGLMGQLVSGQLALPTGSTDHMTERVLWLCLVRCKKEKRT